MVKVQFSYQISLINKIGIQLATFYAYFVYSYSHISLITLESK